MSNIGELASEVSGIADDIEAATNQLVISADQDLSYARRATIAAQEDVASAQVLEQSAAGCDDEEAAEAMRGEAQRYRADATGKIAVAMETASLFVGAASRHELTVGESADYMAQNVGSSSQPSIHSAISAARSSANESAEAVIFVQGARDHMPASGNDTTAAMFDEAIDRINVADHNITASKISAQTAASQAREYASIQVGGYSGGGSGSAGQVSFPGIPGYGETPIPLEERFSGGGGSAKEEEKDYGEVNEEGRYVKSDQTRNADGSYKGGTETLGEHVEKFTPEFKLGASKEDQQAGPRKINGA